MNMLIHALLLTLPLVNPNLSRVEVRELGKGKSGECSIVVSVLVPGAHGPQRVAAGDAEIFTAALRAKPEAGKLSETDSASLEETIVSGQTDVEVRLVAPHGCMVSATGAGNQEQLLVPVVTTLPPGRYQLTFYLARLADFPFAKQ